MKSKTCKICLLDKEPSEFDKYQQTCKECFHLLRCYICKEVFEKKDCRAKARCNKCDNKLHDSNKRKNPTPTYLEKVERNRITRRKGQPNYKKQVYSKEAKSIRRLRGSVKDLFRSWKTYKTQKTFNYLNYTKEEFLQKFGSIEKDMHIDHKIPITWFIVGSPVSLIYDMDNLQILPAKENISKRDRYASPISQSYHDLALPHIKPEYVNKLLIEK